MTTPKIMKHQEIAIVDVDKNSEYITKYDIMSIPTLLVLNDDDTVEQQISGTRINKFLKENFKE
jgi:hypothetical protein